MRLSFRLRGRCECIPSASKQPFFSLNFKLNIGGMKQEIIWTLALTRENRERRIGIDRVKDAVEKCLMQVFAHWSISYAFLDQQILSLTTFGDTLIKHNDQIDDHWLVIWKFIIILSETNHYKVISGTWHNTGTSVGHAWSGWTGDQ